MNIGLIKIGSRVNFTDKSRGPGIVSGEPIIFAKMLGDSGHKVKVLTEFKSTTVKERADINKEFVELVDINEVGDLDGLVIWCGFVNFWGGAEDTHVMDQYKFINNFKGKIVFIITDMDVPPIQVYDKIKGKEWAKKYDINDVLVTRDDIQIICQSSAPEIVKEVLKGFPHKSIQHSAIWQLPGIYNKTVAFNPDAEYDLIYGSVSNRIKRYPKVKKWFLNKDIKSALFGRDILADKPFAKHLVGLEHNSTFVGKVKYGQEVIDYSNSIGKATVVIGDPDYERSRLMPNRFVESVLANIVAFIDIDLDPERTIIKNKELNDFLYVSTREELVERLEKIQDVEFRRKICEMQLDEIKFGKEVLVNDVVNLL